MARDVPATLPAVGREGGGGKNLSRVGKWWRQAYKVRSPAHSRFIICIIIVISISDR